MPRTFRSVVVGSVGLVVTAAAGPLARAVVLHPGDIVVTDHGANFGGPGRVIRFDPVTGVQTLVSEGQLLGAALGKLTFDALGNLFVVASGTVVQVDPSTGVQSPVTASAAGFAPRGIAAIPGGDLLSTNEGIGAGGAGIAGLVRINPSTGVKTTIFQSMLFGFADDVVLENSASALLAADDNGIGRLIRVDLGTGAYNVVSAGNLLTLPTGVALDGMGNAFVTNLFDTVVRVNLATGAQSMVSSSGLLHASNGVATLLDGRLVVTNGSFGGDLITIDPTTGMQSAFGAGGFLGGPDGVAIVQIPAPASVTSVGLWLGAVATRRRRS